MFDDRRLHLQRRCQPIHCKQVKGVELPGLDVDLVNELFAVAQDNSALELTNLQAAVLSCKVVDFCRVLEHQLLIVFVHRKMHGGNAALRLPQRV